MVKFEEACCAVLECYFYESIYKNFKILKFGGFLAELNDKGLIKEYSFSRNCFFNAIV